MATEHKDFYQLYADTLSLQALFCAEETRAVLSLLESFHKADQILEVGCGAGAQIDALADMLSSKEYFGIDVAQPLLDLAKARHSSKSNVHFECHDVLAFQPSRTFDFVLSFAVLQHLSDTDCTLRKFSELLNSNGVVAIYDTNAKDEFQSYPELPALRDLYRKLTEEQTSGKRKSHCLDRATSIASQLGFEITLEKQTDYVARGSKYRDVFFEYIRNVISLIEMKWGSKMDRKAILEELTKWHADPTAWVTQTGGSWLVLKKK